MDWKKTLMHKDVSIGQAICNLNDTGLQIILVVNSNGQLNGTVTDGDIRRGLLRGLTLDDSIHEIMNKAPFVVPKNVTQEVVLSIMSANRIHQLPIVGENNCVSGLHLWEKATQSSVRPNFVVLMAGGLGSRLRPHTEQCPKPMLPLSGKPIIEHIIERIKKEGFSNIVISVRYLGHMIEDYFECGMKWGVNITYLNETEPLGTAGALSLLENHSNLPIIVSNGDVITDIRYGELLDYHIQQKATATMAVRMHELQNPFGVVKVNGVNIVGFEEKPTYRSNVNAGIYVLDPLSLKVIKKNEHCDMPSLFQQLIEKNSHVIVYPMHEQWVDIGRKVDYHKAIDNLAGVV